MSSILTNAGAMTALQSLQNINKNLATTQNRISTGLRVSEASHNAAYWSIATTMRSDNNAMSTVQDALGLGAAQVDIAYLAMDNVKDTLDELKTKLVAASQPDVDKAKIQEEITQLQNDLKAYAEAATFSGGNWLSVSETSTQSVVASFIRDANGIRLGTIDVDTSRTALFNSDAGQTGLLEGAMAVAKDGLEAVNGEPSDGEADNEAEATITGIGDHEDWAAGDTLSFSISLNGGQSATVSLTLTEDDLADDEALEGAIQAALAEAFDADDVTVALDGGTLTFTGGGDEGDTVAISNVSATTLDEDTNITNFDITNADSALLANYLSALDSAFQDVSTAAADLGAIKSRIESQSSFVGNLMDAVDRGIGQLVDADMEEESTRLQALQTQQQLGIQALSIANANSQNILALFR